MVVGTMSNSGKSVINAGLCRYFARRGVRVAPFKAQNMALNSFVTSEGGEMGRAQVCQAKAAGISPHTDMNPILLKPTGESFSQVIADGYPIDNFNARDYYSRKKEMKSIAHKAYDRLAAQYELIVIEGAGSPAEINLMDEDFVNMDMAEYAGADTILVADIDRGGVFASITGTIALLPPHFRSLIKGIIINKFRGDKSLIESGIQQINEMTGIPVLGVLPYIFNLSIEDEDSLGLENRSIDENYIIDIAVIHIPRISNFTDFLCLEKTGGVQVRYVNCPENMGIPDLIIIPGTKNVRADMAFLRENGFVQTLVRLSSQNIPVFGICGGYQMLGISIKDPYGVEGAAGSETGLGLLSVETVLEREKELAQVEGFTNSALPFAQKGTCFKGYEIHVGQTMAGGNTVFPLTVTRRRTENTNERVGAISDNGLIFGCYVHGIFDNATLRKQLLDWLCERKAVTPLNWNSDDGDEYDLLTDTIEEHVDLSYFANKCPV
ncbi:MAG: cobyric acid synthase [Chitinispirillia bacterium]